MPFRWNGDLATGIKAIDFQHQEMFLRAEKLADACKQGKGKEVLEELFAFLRDYTVQHFGMEEKWMTDLLYPGYPLHKAQHEKFIDSMLDLENKLEAEGKSTEIAIRLSVLMGSWLVNHINAFDKSLAIFLKNDNQAKNFI